MDIFGDYEIVIRDNGDALVFRHKGGEVLLTTMRVSLDTLVRIALEDEVI